MKRIVVALMLACALLMAGTMSVSGVDTVYAAEGGE